MLDLNARPVAHFTQVGRASQGALAGAYVENASSALASWQSRPMPRPASSKDLAVNGNAILQGALLEPF
jgi:hypothetical protein